MSMSVAQCTPGGGWGCREWEPVRLRLLQIMYAVTGETRGVAHQQHITTQFKSACSLCRIVERSARAAAAAAAAV